MAQDGNENQGARKSEAYSELVMSARVYFKNDKRIDTDEWQHLLNEATELGLAEDDALRAAREAIHENWSPPLSPPEKSQALSTLRRASGSDSLQARSLGSCSAADVTVSRLKKGTVINGTYRLEEEIGAGGMGVVWRVEHTTLRTNAAIKFLKHALNAESTARFLREARTAAKLQSRYLARVFDCAQLETGELFIVMEYFDGMGLDAYLRKRGPLSIEEAVDFIMQACVGLAAAHKCDIVHRDIKPANLFLTNVDGTREVKIVDFGLSRLAQPEDGEGLTRDQILLGTPEYAPPEQFGNAMNARKPADIWALGATLHCLLTGLPPFPKDPKLSGLFQMSDLLKRVTEANPEPLSQKRKGMPPGLDKVIAKCLEKRPEDRYPTVADFALDLATFGSTAAEAQADEVDRLLCGGLSKDEMLARRASRVSVLGGDKDATRASKRSRKKNRVERPSDQKSNKVSMLVAAIVAVVFVVLTLVVVYFFRWDKL